MCRGIDNNVWEQIRAAFAAGVGLRELAWNRNWTARTFTLRGRLRNVSGSPFMLPAFGEIEPTRLLELA
jgi:hypothetical protein